MAVAGRLVAALMSVVAASASAPSPADSVRRKPDDFGRLLTPLLDDRGTTIAPPARLEPMRERPVRAPDEPAEEARPERPPQEVSLDTVRVNEIRVCRLDVAASRPRNAPPPAAGVIVARWTLLADGTVSEVEIVAEEPTDSEVLSCAKRTVSAWAFDWPRAPVRQQARVSLAEAGRRG